MYKFSQFEIKNPAKGFEGDKIKIDRILNREIIVHDYKIEDSKVDDFKKKGSGKCLCLQITFDNQYRVVFTGSSILMEMITQIPKDKFPFTTTIIRDDQRLKFT